MEHGHRKVAFKINDQLNNDNPTVVPTGVGGGWVENGGARKISREIKFDT